MREGFPGSVFITDEKLPNKRTYTPRNLDVPLFMNKRVRVRANYEPYRNYIEKNKKLYLCPESPLLDDDRASVNGVSQAELEEQCPKPLWKLGRTNFEGAAWKLAPNRYNIKDECCTRPGTKGAIFSTLLRVPQTLPGRFAPPKLYGCYKFYDIPRGVNWNNFCNKRKGKFLSDARTRKPTLRFMVNDLNLCWRDPTFPGPADYYPKNHTLDHKLAKVYKHKKVIVYKFLENSVVPDPNMEIHKNIAKNAMAPGPGRFNPLEIACPCSSKYIFNPLIWDEIEQQKRNKYRRLPYKKINAELYCSPPHLRNIKGHGFTWIFKSKYSREKKTGPSELNTKMEKENKMQHSAKYIQMITRPNRLEISIRSGDEIINPRPPKLHFNTIYKPVIRKKIKSNKRIGFMSGCPRFPYDEDTVKTSKKPNVVKKEEKEKEVELETSTINKQTSTHEKSISFVEKLEHFSYDEPEAVMQRLTRLPKRFVAKRIAGREKTFAFSPLPAPKLLIKEDELGRYDSSEMPLYIKEINPEDYFKDEFRSHLIYKIMKDSLGQRPIDLLYVQPQPN